MITVSKTLLSDLHEHGIEAFPEECCGALLGDVSGDQKILKSYLRIENESEENKHRRFAVTPKDYLWVERQAKAKKLSLLGFFHTHPDHPAQPSVTDLKFAWPHFSYVILSVLSGKPDQINSFLLNEEKAEFEQEELILVE